MAVKIAKIEKDDVERLCFVDFIDIGILRQKQEEDPVVFVAFDEKDACGIIALEPIGVSHRLAYLYVAPHVRRAGIGRSLLDAVRIYDPKICLEEGEHLQEDIDLFLTNCGFVLNREVDLYTFDRTEETLAYCGDLMRMHGNAVMEMMRRRGFDVMMMGMAPRGLLDKLGEEIGEGFDEEMNPFNIKNLDEDWSYIVSKGEEPVAFVACTCSEGRLSVEMLCARKDYMGLGPAMMALMTLLERVMSDDSLEKVTTAVMRKNDDVVKLLDDKFYELITDKKKVKIFTRAN